MQNSAPIGSSTLAGDLGGKTIWTLNDQCEIHVRQIDILGIFFSKRHNPVGK